MKSRHKLSKNCSILGKNCEISGPYNFYYFYTFAICKMNEKPGQMCQKCLTTNSVAVFFGRSRILPII